MKDVEWPRWAFNDPEGRCIAQKGVEFPWRALNCPVGRWITQKGVELSRRALNCPVGRWMCVLARYKLIATFVDIHICVYSVCIYTSSAQPLILWKWVHDVRKRPFYEHEMSTRSTQPAHFIQMRTTVHNRSFYGNNCGVAIGGRGE